MAESNEPKQPPQRHKPSVSSEDADVEERPMGNTGDRGEVVRAAGNKVHGDKLEGVIPGKPERDERPTRDDGDNDDEGELK